MIQKEHKVSPNYPKSWDDRNRQNMNNQQTQKRGYVVMTDFTVFLINCSMRHQRYDRRKESWIQLIFQNKGNEMNINTVIGRLNDSVCCPQFWILWRVIWCVTMEHTVFRATDFRQSHAIKPIGIEEHTAPAEKGLPFMDPNALALP